ncbi:zinc finger protein 260-like isoform X7 [Plodia interpunctella]|uniref:zinc finger protein 260-like isoform X7 n=1 Tax=Plodia interpunctella TaxID=58824 RepID=UPI0023674D2C|nr:zinc finger protein 260-like isoform X5 [Plodia interpunctella]
MAAKSSEWRPGPTVCRCCLTEGCYKDISTEYFWMGKREVYAEMLKETLEVTISYSKTGGPNSNSRLICEPCISRLRDATEFKRQVVECERVFMQHLDPGSTSLDIEVDSEPMEKIKIEGVKLEKSHSDDEEFGDRHFGDDDDDDDDDLDNQPLTKLASRVPKKESVDLLDLLDTSKPAQKRKSTVKVKPPPSKKAKTKIEAAKAKPSSSKAKPEKKKKGRKPQDIHVLVNAESVLDNSTLGLQELRNLGSEKREIFKNNISTIIESCTAYPFKYRKGTYLCFFCKSTFREPEKLREHNLRLHYDNKTLKPRKYEPLKIDLAGTVCKICGSEIGNYEYLKTHLAIEHGKVIDETHGVTVLPYQLNKDEHVCQICGKTYEMFLSLHKHMNDHYDHFICETCGKSFATSQRMMNHSRTHERGDFPCKRCDESFLSLASLYAHVAKVHRSNKRYKCPICDEKFVSYKHRLKHLSSVHGEKTAIFPCPSCPRVFDLCSRRTEHIRFQHLQERNHVCTICGMKFFTNYELQEHSIKHGGERIYQCDVCKKSYARLKTLREHMRIHNNDRRFVCSVCGQAFIQNCSLKQHLRVHHPTHMKLDVF